MNITATEAAQLHEGGALLLDVREDDEWEAGRAPGARHIRLSELPDHVDDVASDTVVVCVCRSGHRSGRAAQFLGAEGRTVHNLEGGMLAWAEAGLPLESDTGEPTII
jgi:rhodanese-related sulfurtransferase